MQATWSKKVFARNLKFYMEEAGKNQKEMAKIIGVSAPTFNEWLKEKKYPRIDKIERLADYFGVLKSDLIEDKRQQFTQSNLSDRKKAFMRKIEGMSDNQLERLEQILALVENKKV